MVRRWSVYECDGREYLHSHVPPFSSKYAPLEEWEFEENCLMKSVREYMEHGYAGLEQAMRITADPKQWFLMASRPYVVDMYISCLFSTIVMSFVLEISVPTD